MTEQSGRRFTLSQALDRSPIIAAVKDEEQLRVCLTSDCAAVFLLFGNICNIGGLVEQVKQEGKLALVHMEFIDGLALREISVSFIQIRRAKELGLTAVQRFFLIDSIAFESVHRQMAAGCADYVEVLPAVLPKILRGICQDTSTPVIASGMITDKEDVLTALDCGAAAISSTNPQVWFM